MITSEFNEGVSKVLQGVVDLYFPSWGSTVLYNNETLTIHNPEERYTTQEITDKLQELINQLKQ
jgi:hypothetical protein